jgi:hypothetical protein
MRNEAKGVRVPDHNVPLWVRLGPADYRPVPLAFAALVLLTAMGIVLYYGIAFIERIAVPWAPKN